MTRFDLPCAEHARIEVEKCFRLFRGRIISALTRRVGVSDLDRVTNAVQDAFVIALENWSAGSIPEKPEGWLVQVAYRRLVDAARTSRRFVAFPDDEEIEAEVPVPDEYDELRLMFLCCHPSLSRAAQIALTLRVGFGFTTPQIANTFLSDESTVAQRIVRAKRILREQGVTLELPSVDELDARLSPILDCLYSVFTEAHSPTTLHTTDTDSLCAEALRLSRLLRKAACTARPETLALHALICFHFARHSSRKADDGSLLLLQEQDRHRWDARLLREGFEALELSARGDVASKFHLEAGIAACHASAPTFADTDWPVIVELYGELLRHRPSPVVEVNKAFAVGMAFGARAGLDELDAIPERELIARYPYALAAYAELHSALGNWNEARTFLDRAIALQTAPSQQALLVRKRRSLDRP